MTEFTPNLDARHELHLVSQDLKRHELVYEPNPPRLVFDEKEFTKFSSTATRIAMVHLIQNEAHTITAEDIENYGHNTLSPMVRVANRFNDISVGRLKYKPIEVIKEDGVAISSLCLYTTYFKAPEKQRIKENKPAPEVNLPSLPQEAIEKLSIWSPMAKKLKIDVSDEQPHTLLVLRALTLNRGQVLNAAAIIDLIGKELPDAGMDERVIKEVFISIARRKKKLPYHDKLKLLSNENGEPALSFVDDTEINMLQAKLHRQPKPGSGEPTPMNP